MTCLRQWAIWCVLFVACAVPDAGSAQPFFSRIRDEDIGNPPFCAGIAVGDYNNDGWPDLCLTEFIRWGGWGSMLLHNTGNGLMYDRTNAIGPSMLGTKGGPSFADFDNDGVLDLFIRHGSVFFDGQDRLLRNDRSKFTDVTAAADLTGSQPTWQAIWLDYNRDGFLDLYVGHFRAFADEPDLRNTLWHNNGDGTFSDVTSESGLDLRLTQGGGAIGGMSAADFNGDGWPDLYVGASGSPNRLFLNTAQGGF